jgi:Bacterial Ig-like domain/Secretion system C-terminal sorting domain
MKRIVLFIIASCLYGISFAQNITAIEYFIDSDVGVGNGTAVTITPGPSINMSFNVSLSAASDGFHILSVRTKDANNFWSNTHTTPFYKLPAGAVAAAPNINKMEYFIDADPGFGVGTDVPVTSGTSINGLAVSVSLASVADGFHTLTFRTRDANLKWSVAHSTPFYKLPAGVVAAAPNINKMEYFIDADPGFGIGTDVPVTSGTSINGLAVSVSLASVADGFHTLTFRTRDANLNWSVAHSSPFYKLPAGALGAAPNINKMEYFIDADPGVGAGTDVPVTVGTSLSDVGVSIPLAAVTDGFHVLTFRARDANGRWSVSQSTPFYKLPASALSGAPNLVKLEYFIDTDPGQGAGVAVALSAVTSITDFLVSVPVTNLSIGVHNISFRALDDLGRWSPVQTGSFIFGVSTPTVVVSSTATDPTSVTPIPVTITFSESVTGFDILDIVVTNGTAGTLAGTGASYTANITPTASGVVTVSVPADAAISVTSTGNTASNTLSRTYQASKSTQTITFNTLVAKTFGDVPFNLTATSTSGLAVSYASSDATVASISGSTVTILKAGTTTITASQSGNDNFLAATDVLQTLTVNKAGQTITFAALAAKTLGDAPFNLTATASSTLAVSFSSTSDKITIAGAQVTMTKAGSVTITANQAGNTSFNPAPAVDRTFCINPAKPTITVSGEDTETVTLTSSSATGNQWFLNGAAIAGATASTLTANATKVGVYSLQVTIETCASVKSNDFTVVITGLEPGAGGLKLYPNPVAKEVIVSIPGGQGGKIHLSDLRGAQMLSINSNREEERIDLEDLSTGVYFVTITTAKGTYRARLVKE